MSTSARKWIDPLTRLSAERRDDPRVAVALSATVSSSDFLHPLEVQVRDLSAGGACIATSAPLGTQGIHQLRIETTGKPLELPAEGLWLEKHQGAHYVGMRFAPLPRSDERALMQIVSEASQSVVEFLVFESALQGIGRGEALALANTSRMRTIDTGTWLYRQDTPSADGDCVFLVLDGEIRLNKRLRHRTHQLVDLGRGCVFGGFPALAGMKPPESAVANEATTLLELDPAAISYLLQHSPWLTHRLTQSIVSGYADRMDRFLELQGTPGDA